MFKRSENKKMNVCQGLVKRIDLKYDYELVKLNLIRYLVGFCRDPN